MQTIMKHFATVLVVAVCLTGCRQSLRPRLILQGEPVGDDFWLAAPYVAAVRVVDAQSEGSPEPVFPGGPKTLQLVRFSADVENAIKGDLKRKNITFFFFAKLDQNPNYYLHPGKRYIVSLRDEAGTLRSWADATQLKMEIYSGSHDQTSLPLDLGPAATIAYIRLTPGMDCNLQVFADTLGWPNTYGGAGYVSDLLGRLQQHPDRYLRDSACLSAASMFGHQPRCLDQVLQSPDERMRNDASKRIGAKDAGSLLGRLRNEPLTLFPNPWADYILQMFQIYTGDRRPEVRRAACVALRNFAPGRNVEACQ